MQQALGMNHSLFSLNVVAVKVECCNFDMTAWLQLRRATALWHGNTFQHCFNAWKEFVHGQKEKTARTIKVHLPALQLSFRLQCQMLCLVVPCYAMLLCYAMLCYAMLCYAMLCYAMLCYAMLCYGQVQHARVLLTDLPCLTALHTLLACTGCI